LRLAFNAMVLHGPYTGVHRAAWELLKALAELSAGDEIRVYAGRSFDAGGWSSPGVSVHRTWFPASWRTLRILYENLWLPRRALRDGAALLHCPAYTAPVGSLLPVVVTIHDVIALTHPELCTRSNVRHYRRMLPRTVERATRIIVPSEASRRALLGATKAPPARVRVVPFGVSERFRPVTDAASLAAFRESFSLPEHYALFVGRMERKKNIPNLVKGFFAAVMAKRLPHRLVLAGPSGTASKEVSRLVRELDFAERVLRIERVPEESLPMLYSGADCVALVSRVEGFGFPVLEAMACGSPVIVSRDRALRDLAPDEAPRVAWDDLAAMREAFESILTDEKLRRKLSEAGLRRAAEFTWKLCAERTRAVYAEALAEYESIGREEKRS
jgi:glycosyltransferase involved in cell wall biosynthesis